MPTNDELDDDLEESERTERPDNVRRQREHIRKLEDDVKTWKDRAVEADELKREVAFRRAGFDPDAGLTKLLFRAYDGELTTDAIKAAAAEAGITAGAAQPSKADEERRQIDDEVSRMDRGASASTGRNPSQDQEFDEVMRQAAREKWPEHKFDEALRRYGRMADDEGSNVNPNWW